MEFLRCDIKNTSFKKKPVGKLDFIRIKKFCTSKNTTEKIKREDTDQEKRFAHHLSGKRPVFKKYNYSSRIRNKEPNLKNGENI